MSQDPENEHLRIFLPEDDARDAIDIEDDDPDLVSGPDLDTVFARLGDGTAHVLDLVGFSDLDRNGVDEVRQRWPQLPRETRELHAQRAVELAEERWDIHLGRFFRILTEDESPVVRQLAVDGLEGEPDAEIASLLLELLRDDLSDDVRTAAAVALGPLAEYGELDELDPQTTTRIREGLYTVLADTGEPIGLRRRALESVSVMTDDRLPQYIDELYEADDLGSRTSAIFAMGRSDSDEWLPIVLGEFANDDAEVRFEAARAAGRFENTDALPGLAELARDEDTEVRQAAIAAIGSIGGKPGLRLLEQLRQGARAAADQEAIDEAYEDAQMMDEIWDEFEDEE